MTKQDYEAPPEFIAAIERRFGPIDIDLAARADNAKAPRWLGHGASLWDPSDDIDGDPEDSLSVNWSKLINVKVAYLNPPFLNMRPWAAQCAAVRFLPRWTLMLSPASIGCRWYRDHVHGKANVDGISRIKFLGTDAVYPKDLMLSAFGYGVAGWGCGLWRWDRPENEWFV